MRISSLLFATSLVATGCTGSNGADGMNGTNGTNGTDGSNSLIKSTAEPPGANCPDGGTRLDVGEDADGDGQLSDAEISQTVYVCNGSSGTAGAQSLVAITAEPAGTNCTAGGQRIDYGIDDNGNGTLDVEEIDGTAYACNGTDGLESLIATTDEPPGANCPSGGTKVTSGIDDDGNGTLDPNEVDATAYVCNGATTGGTLFLSQDSNSNGLYSLDLTTGAATSLGMTGVTGTTVGLTYDPQSRLLIGSKFAGLLAIQPDGSGFTDRGGNGSEEALTYDYVNDVLYGGINGQFFTVDLATGDQGTSLTGPGIDAEGLAFRADTGTIYAIGGSSTELLAYDIASATWTTVGTHGLNLDNGGLTYDPWAHVLYATGGNDGNLYKIDPATAQATLIGSTGLASANGGIEFVPAVYP